MKTARLVRASSMTATYNAGVFYTDSNDEAIELARDGYASSAMGRQFRDVGAFRFYVALTGSAALSEVGQ